MSIESLTRLGSSRKAARSLVRRLQLPRHMANNGTVRVNVDLSDIQYRPPPRRSSYGDGTDVDALKAQIEQLQAEVTKLETQKSSIEVIAAGHAADFERERERSDKLMANTMSLGATAMSARLKATRLESELAARRSHSWMRLRTCRRAAACQQFRPNALSRPEEPIMLLKSIPAAAARVRTFAELAALVMFAALITVSWNTASHI
jgi:hypothetical protein